MSNKKINANKNITPFQRWKQNIDQFVFWGNEENIAIFKECIADVLDKIDDFYLNNDLYSSVDYDEMLDNLLSKNEDLQFYITNYKIANKGTLGLHYGIGTENREIWLLSEEFENNSRLQRTFCHEFIHEITIGSYIKKFRMGPRTYNLENQSGKLSIYNHKGTKQLSEGYILHGVSFLNEFLIEGYTDYLTQMIYPGELNSIYEPQIKLVEFMGKIFGEHNENIKGFLRGYISAFDNIFSLKEYNRFDKACSEYLTKTVNSVDSTQLLSQPSYIKIQELFVSSLFKFINKNLTGFKASDLVKMHDIIVNQAPGDNNVGDIKRKNNKVMKKLVCDFASKIFDTQEEQETFLNEYKSVLRKMTAVSNNKFAINDFSEDVFFKICDRNLTILAYPFKIDLNSGIPKTPNSKLNMYPSKQMQLAYKMKNDYVPHMTIEELDYGCKFSYYKDSDKPFNFAVEFDDDNTKKAYISDMDNELYYLVDFNEIEETTEKDKAEIRKDLNNLDKLQRQAIKKEKDEIKNLEKAQ